MSHSFLRCSSPSIHSLGQGFKTAQADAESRDVGYHHVSLFESTQRDCGSSLDCVGRHYSNSTTRCPLVIRTEVIACKCLCDCATGYQSGILTTPADAPLDCGSSAPGTVPVPSNPACKVEFSSLLSTLEPILFAPESESDVLQKKL